MKRSAIHRACSVVAASVLVCSPVIAAAQTNPFVPPTRGAGLSREEVAEIVRREAERNRSAQPQTQTGSPTNPPGSVSDIPSPPGAPGAGAPGAPGGSPLAGAGSPIPPVNASGQMNSIPVEVPTDPIAELLANGGNFVGCVGNTPVFKDSAGGRAYFTTKERRKSHEARRYARC